MKYFLCLIMGFSTMVWADVDDDSFSNYESIVNELKADSSDVIESNDPWDQIGIYGGVGLATSFIRADLPNAQKVSGLLKGLEGHFGIDLFTKAVRVEGAFRAFAQESLDDQTNASMKEFELRAVFVPAPFNKNLLRMGTGIAARYLDLSTRAKIGSSGWDDHDTSTPAAVFFVGMQRKIGRNIAFGPDIAYRSTLVDDSYMKSTWDLCLKFDANF